MDVLLENTLAFIKECCAKDSQYMDIFGELLALELPKRDEFEARATSPLVIEAFANLNLDKHQHTMTFTLLKSLIQHYEELSWAEISPSYGGQEIARGFTFASLAGIALEGWRNPVYHAQDFAFGFTIQAPQVYYPPHDHETIELYSILHGKSKWQQAEGAFKEKSVGDIIFHDRFVPHAMKTTDDYLINFYLWSGNLNHKPTMN